MGRAAAAVAVSGLVASAMGMSAGADPKQLSTTVVAGVGSDTTQDVLNALAGYHLGTKYDPVSSGSATDDYIISFDATDPTGATGDSCITTKLGGPAFSRPNGSSNGQRALSRSLDGGAWGASNATCPNQDLSGSVDFARSSSGPNAAGNQLTFIPFGNDALSFAYYRTDGSPVTELTPGQITQIFQNGRTTINGVSILPCGIQTGSGTYASWLSSAGVTAAEDDAATAECNALLGRAQENDADELVARGDLADAAQDGTQVIIGFSAGAFIAKANGVADPAIPAGLEMGTITTVGTPVDGSGANRTPNATFFANPTYGRTVYNVVPSVLINSPGPTNLGLKGLFRGPTSAICQATDTIGTFGFLVAPNCGDTTDPTLQAALRSGNG